MSFAEGPPCSFDYQGEWTSGVFASPNFPFQYYKNMGECHYGFHPDIDMWKVCLQFCRFDLGEKSCDTHYIQFPGGEKYCGTGWLEAAANHSVLDTRLPDNVFKENFCCKQVLINSS